MNEDTCPTSSGPRGGTITSRAAKMLMVGVAVIMQATPTISFAAVDWNSIVHSTARGDDVYLLCSGPSLDPSPSTEKRAW